MKKTRMRLTPFLSRRPFGKDSVAWVPPLAGSTLLVEHGGKTKAVLMEEKLKDGK